ncbi:hypothetical protein V8D89_015385 [Ganoderma adspersum]
MSASLVPTFGAVLIGNFISAALYGLTTLQVYLYFRKRWSVDPMRLKSFIFYIWLLETVHACQLVAFLFRSLIVEFGNIAALQVTRVSEDNSLPAPAQGIMKRPRSLPKEWFERRLDGLPSESHALKVHHRATPKIPGNPHNFV